MTISLTILGNPVGKQRARVCRTGHAYTPAKTVNYETLVKELFAVAYPNHAPWTGPIKMVLSIFIAPSKEEARRFKKNPDFTAYATKKPDIDNVLKVFADSLNGIAYHDDKQIVAILVGKFLSMRPRVEIEIEELT